MYKKFRIFLAVILTFVYSGISLGFLAQAQTTFGDELVTNVTMTNTAGQNIDDQTVFIF
ncbi:hypothetical protein [Macrococcoides canis]|uniref:hypothetical protein n=1 Tax=Macrococcoides canis TaxID=1855823 RepID=UPI00207C1EC4|nr:hypothetical protein [Macrococcus canis]MCO4097769.1 hypothetical protein [Macrococcus canis]UTH06706.1 hypothetical protein KFV07_11300 [Macrococcus canis]UTH09057.1 hypothetical protein KFV08_11330 [Macrococcus canis]